MFHATLKPTTWAKVADQVKAVNPELYQIISDIDPGPSYRLYVGEYPYGCQILKRGMFQIPLRNGEMVPLSDPRVPKRMQADLEYNVGSNPVSLLLKNSVEIFLNKSVTADTLAFSTVAEGSLLGTSRITSEIKQQPAFLWNMSSGARTISMLPKISQAKKYKRLRSELNIDTSIPTNANDHWHVFKDIANCDMFPCWTSINLYFSEKWFQSLKDPRWVHFENYILSNVRKFLGYMGVFQIWDVIFSSILRERDIRPNLNTNNTVKHLFQISSGLSPGISPAIDEKQAPIELLQKIFTEIYVINDYIPTIMTPNYFALKNPKEFIYYSLQNPSSLNTPKKKDNSSLISELYETKSLLDKYLYGIRNYKLNLENTYFYDFSIHGDIDAFHPNPEKYSIIRKAKEIIDKDPRFKKTLYPTKNKEIAYFSSIFKGCFRIKGQEKY